MEASSKKDAIIPCCAQCGHTLEPVFSLWDAQYSQTVDGRVPSDVLQAAVCPVCGETGRLDRKEEDVEACLHPPMSKEMTEELDRRRAEWEEEQAKKLAAFSQTYGIFANAMSLDPNITDLVDLKKAVRDAVPVPASWLRTEEEMDAIPVSHPEAGMSLAPDYCTLHQRDVDAWETGCGVVYEDYHYEYEYCPFCGRMIGEEYI